MLDAEPPPKFIEKEAVVTTSSSLFFCVCGYLFLEAEKIPRFLESSLTKVLSRWCLVLCLVMLLSPKATLVTPSVQLRSRGVFSFSFA